MCVCVSSTGELASSLRLPENMLAIAAIKKLSTTPGPAIVFATMPATKYMPVPQHDPTPSDVKSNVVKHFYGSFVRSFGEKHRKNENEKNDHARWLNARKEKWPIIKNSEWKFHYGLCFLGTTSIL